MKTSDCTVKTTVEGEKKEASFSLEEFETIAEAVEFLDEPSVLGHINAAYRIFRQGQVRDTLRPASSRTGKVKLGGNVLDVLKGADEERKAKLVALLELSDEDIASISL